MKLKVVLFTAFIFVAAFVVLAVDSTKVTVDSLVKNTSDVINAIKGLKAGDVTWLIVSAVVIKLLISLTNFGPIAAFFNTPKMKAAKPYIAMILGILSGIINNLLTGMNLTASLIAGFVAGLGAVGIHESVDFVKLLTIKNVKN